MNYSEQLKSPHWQRKRLEILTRDNWTCQKCQDTEKQLHVHHLEYHSGAKSWEYDNKYLTTLCCHCHYIIGALKIDYNSINIVKHQAPNPIYTLVFASYFNQHNIVIIHLSMFDEHQNEVLYYVLSEGLVSSIDDLIKKSIDGTNR